MVGNIARQCFLARQAVLITWNVFLEWFSLDFGEKIWISFEAQWILYRDSYNNTAWAQRSLNIGDILSGAALFLRLLSAQSSNHRNFCVYERAYVSSLQRTPIYCPTPRHCAEPQIQRRLDEITLLWHPIGLLFTWIDQNWSKTNKIATLRP